MCGRFLRELAAGPSPAREILFTCIGRTISFLCSCGGWFMPMYGAGKLERGNIVEYETAARMAMKNGFPQMVDALLRMAEIEWDHEVYFRAKAQSHWLTAIFPIWDPPPPRTAIRSSFAAEFPDHSTVASK